ncbi:MAG: ribosomal L7Ae/L30e/S12e/Gadd45 family protein [Lachnospiraceae bacterium]|nr:ribosomal L7Ae/L30e/S12e/Gadd45 family protein [Lachnospiraceae bacterium]
MNQNKALSMLGLAQKAGKVVSGEFSVEKAIKSGHAYLVILAEDVSENTRKHFTDMCTYHKVPIAFSGTKDELGNVIGRGFRASVAVTDPGFAGSIAKKLEMSCEN